MYYSVPTRFYSSTVFRSSPLAHQTIAQRQPCVCWWAPSLTRQMGPGAFALGLLQGLAGCGIHNDTMCRRTRLGSFFLPLKFNCQPGRSLTVCRVLLCTPLVCRQTAEPDRAFENRPDATGYIGWAGKMGHRWPGMAISFCMSVVICVTRSVLGVWKHLEVKL